jgi:hypothetical protein
MFGEIEKRNRTRLILGESSPLSIHSSARWRGRRPKALNELIIIEMERFLRLFTAMLDLSTVQWRWSCIAFQFSGLRDGEGKKEHLVDVRMAGKPSVALALYALLFGPLRLQCHRQHKLSSTLTPGHSSGREHGASRFAPRIWASRATTCVHGLRYALYSIKPTYALHVSVASERTRTMAELS